MNMVDDADAVHYHTAFACGCWPMWYVTVRAAADILVLSPVPIITSSHSIASDDDDDCCAIRTVIASRMQLVVT